MDLAELERKLMAAARVTPLNGRVPYAFEKRIMAHITARPAFDQWALWGKALWRGAASCLAIVLLLSAWTVLSPDGSSSTDLSQDLENTMLATIDLNGESW